MLNTAKELHIGIDLGLQSINSNRKVNIEPAEKDWVLNTVMMQEINTKINPKSNAKQEGFEDTFKRIDELESIKVDTAEMFSAPIYKYSDNASYIPLPADYYRAISAVSNVHNIGGVGDPVVVHKDFLSYGSSGMQYATLVGAVKLPSATTDYSDFIVRFLYNLIGIPGIETYDEEVLFDINEIGKYWAYNIGTPIEYYYKHGMETIHTTYSDAKFQLIRMVLDHINYTTGPELGISVYWERFCHFYEKDSFVFVLDGGILKINAPIYTPIGPISSRIHISPTGDDPNTPGVEDTYGYLAGDWSDKANGYISKFEPTAISDTTFYTIAETAAYNAASFTEHPVRVVKSSELSRLNKHYYGKTIYDSPLGVIKQGRLIIYHDSSFEFNKIDLEYYRRPRLISLLNNQGCEITSDSFRMELVEKTIQKLSSKIQDPNYRNVLQENLILE